MPGGRLQRGDRVVVYDGVHTVAAQVTNATPDGRWIALAYDGVIAGWYNVTTAFLDDGGGWATIDARPLQILRQPPG